MRPFTETKHAKASVASSAATTYDESWRPNTDTVSNSTTKSDDAYNMIQQSQAQAGVTERGREENERPGGWIWGRGTR